jgi:hypothetical protein
MPLSNISCKILEEGTGVGKGEGLVADVAPTSLNEERGSHWLGGS